MVVVKAQVDAEQAADEQGKDDEPQAAAPARDREAAGEDEDEKRRRHRDHVAIEEERGVSTRRNDREEADGRGDR